MDKTLENLVVELRRGTLVMMVLSVCQKEEYGYEIVERLSKLGISVEASTLYPLLRRLETQDLLNSHWDTSEARPRKYYQISKHGQEVLKALQQEWQTMQEELKKIGELS
jgi:DNA-binding PadR family transcriptional regulator